MLDNVIVEWKLKLQTQQNTKFVENIKFIQMGSFCSV